MQQILIRHKCPRAQKMCQVTGYAADQLDQALEGAEVVVIPAGVPRKVCIDITIYALFNF